MTDFIHRYEPARDAGSPPLLLLHGTGGDENDLLGLGQMISPAPAPPPPPARAPTPAVPRFSRRGAEGVSQGGDFPRRAAELGDFVAEARKQYGIAAPVAVGFSNGANIAAALLLLQPEVLAGAILLRAMVPLSEPPKAELAGKPILLLSGQADPIVPASNSAKLAALLSDAGARVDHKVLPAGHQLSQADVTLARGWISGVKAEAA